MMAELKIILKKLEYIKSQCIGHELKDVIIKKDNDVDKIREDIIVNVKEARQLLIDREELSSLADKAKANQQIRKKIKIIKDNVSKIEKICSKQTDGISEQQNEIIDSLKQHVQFLETKENPSKLLLDDLKNFSIDEKADTCVEIPDLDDNDFQILKKNDQDIDKDLDKILEGLSIIKDIAIDQGKEIQEQNEIIEIIEDKTDKVHDKLKYTNRRLGELLKKNSGNCCCVFIMIIIIIGLVSAIFILLR